MNEPFASSLPDPISAGMQRIESLKATQELLSGLLSADRTGLEAVLTTVPMQDADQPEESPRAGHRRWRRRSN
jgi:hypothetical protein